MGNFLVTGGAGFIGSHIAEALLERGEGVRVLDNLSTGHLSNMDGFRHRIEFIEADAYDIQVSDEEMAKIEELAADPNVIDLISDSISPTIYGLPYEKEALALQLFGGVPKHMPDGTRIKGDIHILLIGDPGTAKSQLLRSFSDRRIPARSPLW